MKKIYYLIVFILAAVFTAPGLLAQVPDGFSYQAVARDAATGDPLQNTALNVRIAILSSIEPEIVVWEEEHSLTSNEFGLFTLRVGDPSATHVDGSATSFAAINWTSGSYYIRPSIQPSGGSWHVMTSSRLVAVPFAMLSKDTESKQSLSQSGDLLILSEGGSVDLSGYIDPDQSLHLENNILSISGTGSQVDLSGYIDPDQTLSLSAENILSISGVGEGIDLSGYIDPDQTLSLSAENILSISGVGEGIDLSGYIDPNQTISKSGNTVTLDGGGGSFSLSEYVNQFDASGDTLSKLPGSLVLGSGQANGSILRVVGTETDPSAPLFEVKNRAGQQVFAVYDNGVQIHVDDKTPPDAKGSRGGFVVAGFDDDATKEIIPGTGQELLIIRPDSARIFVPNNPATLPAKAPGSRGGFAVGGFDADTKGPASVYFNVSGKTEVDLYTDVPRMLWYPQKEAFQAGRILIESADSVGLNSTAFGYHPIASGNYSQAFGNLAKAKGDNSTAIGNQAQARGFDSYAFGSSALAIGQKSFAMGSVGIDSLGDPMGQPTTALGEYSMALGMSSVATQRGSLALGVDSWSSGWYSTALGYRSAASGSYSTALGLMAESTGPNSMALGMFSRAIENYALALGYRATAEGAFSVAVGSYSNATGDLSVAMGYSARAIGDNSYALGRYAYTNNLFAYALGFGANATAQASYAIGYNSNAQSDYSYAIGQEASAEQINAYAIGYRATATGTSSYALGNDAIASASYSSSLGWGANAGAYGSIAMGTNAATTGSYSMAFGQNSQATNTVSTAIGYAAKSGGFGSSSIGYAADARNNYSTAIGVNTIASADYAFAIGRGAQAQANNSTAIGYGAVAGAVNAYAFGTNATSSGAASTSLGYQNTASGDSSIAIGNLNNGSGRASLIFGNANTSVGGYSVNIGSRNTASADRTTAIGYNVTAGGYKSVSLGSNYYKTLTIWIPPIYILPKSGTDTKGPEEGSLNPGEGGLDPAPDTKGFVSLPLFVDRTNDATGTYSLAVGAGNLSQNGGFTYGVYNNASQEYATAIGFANQATGVYGTALGFANIASGNKSMAIGNYTNAQSLNSTALGTYNYQNAGWSPTTWVETDPLVQVGNGTSSTPNDAMVIYKNGYTYHEAREAEAGLYAYNTVSTRASASYGLRSSLYAYSGNTGKVVGTRSYTYGYSGSTGDVYSGEFLSYNYGTGTHWGLYANKRSGPLSDLAEYIYDNNNETEAADVVVADINGKENVVKSTSPYQSSVVGIVSTDPHLLMGSELIKDKETGEKIEGVNVAQLALAGRVPCKVSDENGPIKPGDMVTSSSIPGHAMKWSLLDITEAKDFEELKKMMAENEKRRNAIIGKALESHDAGTGKIIVLISLQ